MKTMEFCDKNFLDTISSVITDSGTGTISYLFDRNTDLDYQSSGYTADTSTTLNITFSPAKVVSRILLQNHNLKQFRIYYNSATANTFSPDINVSGNSDTNHYFAFSSTTVSSIQIQMDDVIETGQERSIGELVISDLKISLDHNPPAKDYKPILKKKKIRHEMPDGGVSIFNVDIKYKTKIKLKYLSDSLYSKFSDLYSEGEQFYFIPMGTTSSWNGAAYEVNWTNDFDFKYAEDSRTQGYEGNIVLEETPSS